MNEFLEYVKKFEAALDAYTCYPTIDNWQKLLEIKAIVHYLCYSGSLTQKDYIPGSKVNPCLN